MHEEPIGPSAGGDVALERAILLTLLGEAEGGWAPAQLAAELEAPRARIDQTLERLVEYGLVVSRAEAFCASRALGRMDAFGLVAL